MLTGQHAGFSTMAEYERFAQGAGGGLAVDGTRPRVLGHAAARQALERLRACAF